MNLAHHREFSWRRGRQTVVPPCRVPREERNKVDMEKKEVYLLLLKMAHMHNMNTYTRQLTLKTACLGHMGDGVGEVA